MNMCEYCNNNEDKMSCLIKCFGKEADNEKQEICLIIQEGYLIMADSEDRYNEGIAKINYCPMCSRKLEV